MAYFSNGTYVEGTIMGTDQVAAFSANAVANTQINVDWIRNGMIDITHLIAIYNPSTVTDLTVKMFAINTEFAGQTIYSYLESFAVPKAATVSGTSINSYAKLFEGLFAGSDIRLVISNDTALGASDAFSAYIRVRGV